MNQLLANAAPITAGPSERLTAAAGRETDDRLHALDLLRGFCALGVAAYHLNMWLHGSSQHLLGTALSFFGTYGVETFFILSGYSLAFAYSARFKSCIEAVDLVAFGKRRIGRLAPLFILVAIFSILGRIVTSGRQFNAFEYLENLLLIFGFVDPSLTPVIGGWSIGVEVVFYCMFPLLVVLRGLWPISLAVSLIFLSHLGFQLKEAESLEVAWRAYVQPVNHFFFFVAGVALFSVRSNRFELNSVVSLAGTAGILAAVIFGSVDLSEQELVSGWTRLGLSIASAALVGLFAITPVKSKFGQRLCAHLGGISYPLYLIHPLVFFAFSRFSSVPVGHSFMLLLVLALLVSLVAYRRVDLPIQAALKRRGW